MATDRNEEVRRRAGIEMELESRVDQSIEIVRAREENERVPYG